MLEICIQTSYDQNVQMILKSYLPVVLGTTLTFSNTWILHQLSIFLSFLCCGVFLCYVCLHYASYVSNIDIVSGLLSIQDFPFGFSLTFTKQNYYFEIKVVL